MSRRNKIPEDTADFRASHFQYLLVTILMKRLGLALLVGGVIFLSGLLLNMSELDKFVNGWTLPGSMQPYPGIGYGIIAFGGLSFGIVAFGGCSIGIIAIGGASVGVVAIGGGSLGLFSFGGCAFGLFGAVGGGAVGRVAIGGAAIGEWVLAGEGKGPNQLTLERQDETAIDYWCSLYPRLREAFPSRWPEIPANRSYLDQLAASSGGGTN